MSASAFLRRATTSLALVASLLASTAAAADLGANPSLTSGSQTINTADFFTGTFSVNNATLYLGSNFSLPASTAFAFTGSGSYLSYTGGGPFTFTLPATASLTRSGSGNTYVYDHVSNAGTVTVSGGTLQFQSGTTFTNSGTATVTGSGSTLYLQGLANTGTLAVNSSGVIQLAGATTTANLGTFTIASGGAVKLTGTLNNASANLTAPTGGVYTLVGGTITGGTIDGAAIAPSTTNSFLDGATIAGNVSLSSNETLTFKNGAGFTGTATVNNGSFYLGSNLTALANSAFVFTGSGSYLSYSGSGPFTLTLPSTASLTRSGTGNTYVYDHLSNAGTVTVSGGTLQFQSGTTFTNSGTATVTGSGSTLYLQGLANTGTLAADTSGVIQLAGTFASANLGTITIASGGSIKLTGNITNTSANLPAPTGGTYSIQGGTITGGTIAAGALTFTSSGGYLDGATLNDNLTLPASTTLRLKGGATFSGTTATLGNSAGLYWEQVGTLSGKAITLGTSSFIYLNGANNTLTLDSTSSITGSLSLYSSGSAGIAFTNQGTLTHTSGSNSIYFPTFANTGTITNTAANNYLVLGNTSTGYNSTNAGGTITVNGTNSSIYLDGNFTFTGGTLNATNGQFYFRGNNTSAHLNGGTLNIASGAHAYLNGTITNTSATLNAPTSGTYELQGGTITGGTIATGALGFTSSGGYLDGATLSDNLTLPASAHVRFTNGGNFTGATATLGSSASLYWQQIGTLANKSITLGSGAYLHVAGTNNTLTLAPTTTVTGDTTIYTDGSTGTAITNQGTISHTTGSGSIYAPSFSNTGNITNTTANNYLVIGSTSTGYNSTNTGGTITVNGTNSSIYLDGNFTFTGGTLNATNGQFYFRGNNTSAHLNGGTLAIATGAHAYLNGTITNTSATLNAPTSGTYELQGGTITGGTIATGALNFTSSGGYLDGASLSDNLTLPASAYVRFTNGGNFTGATATLGNSAGLYWQQVGTLANKSITLGTGAYLYVSGANNTLTLASTTSITGDTTIYTDGNAGTAITNQGTISHTTSSGSIYAPSFSNTGNIINTAANNYLVIGSTSTGYNSSNTGGTITVNGTNSSIYLDGNFTNTGGTLTATNGQFYFRGANTSSHLNGGTLNIASGAHAYLNGTITNTSTTLNAPTSGSYELQGGTITGGTIAAGALTYTSSGGYLSGATLSDNLTIPASAHVRLTGGASFTGATANLAANAGLYWEQAGTLSGKALTLGTGAYIYLNGTNNTLTLDATSSATGNLNIYSSGSTGVAFTNQGTLSHTSGSNSIYLPTFTNSGSISATAGTLYLGYPSAGYNTTNTSTGIVTANGATVYLRGNFANQGTLTAQNNGVLIFDGTNTTGNIGNVTLATGGKARLSGTITNTALAAPTGGSFELLGGTISGGTIAAGALSFTTSGGYLDNVSLLDSINLSAGGYVRFTNGTNFTGANVTLGGGGGAIYWQQSGTLANKTITMSSLGNLYVTGANNSLTLAPTTTVSGTTNVYTDGSTGIVITNQGTITNTSFPGFLYAANFINSGSITATGGTLHVGGSGSAYSGHTFTNSSGGNITVNGASTSVLLENSFANAGSIAVSSGNITSTATLTNTGTISIAAGTTFSESSGSSFSQTAGTLKIDGTFVAPSAGASISGGSVTGTGSITGNFTFAGGTLEPGNSTGTLTFTGNLTLTGGATTIMELGAGTNDRVVVSGTGNSLVFGGALNIVAVSTAFASGQSWNLFTSPARSGTFASIALPYTSQGWVWDTSQLTTTGTLTLTTFVPIPVPEPSTYVLLAAGLGVVFALRRRAVLAKRPTR